MKNLNRSEIKKFVNKYFKIYGTDIRRVSYIIYDDIIEYLVNDHYIFSIKKSSNK